MSSDNSTLLRFVLFVVGGVVLVGMRDETGSLPAQEPNTESKQTAKPDTRELLKTFMSEFVEITPGRGRYPASFVMGTERGPWSEQPAHRVSFNYSFHIAKYEVPQNLYEAVMGNNPSRWKGPRNSAENYSWLEAQEFLQRITRMLREEKLITEQEVIRMPTEAEWEFCCRGGTTTPYSFGESAIAPGDVDVKASRLDKFGWNTGNAAGNDPPVGALQPNPWGLYDMHGYLWEYVSDDWHENYVGAPIDGSSRLPRESETRRIIRGGSWMERYECHRSAYRQPIEVSAKGEGIGLRCIKGRRPGT
jgi:formylglycine-generating enzyme required for sulfatase activity